VIIKGRVIGPHGVLEQHCVVIENGKIKQIAPTAQVLWPEDAQVIDAGENFIAPGFVDMHIHGAMGRDAMDGTVESLAQIAKFHAAGGTTAMTPTTTTHSGEKISAALQAIADAMGHDFGGAQIIGAHIEGPYISAERRGAQPPHYIREPKPEEYIAWLDREGLVTEMTLAPEVPGALELIDALLEHEILPSGGHTAASHEEVKMAVGANTSTAVPVVVHQFPAVARTTEAHLVKSTDSVALQPLTLEEAIKEAEFRDREVFVFRDPEGKVKVLHRTKDGKLELIEAP